MKGRIFVGLFLCSLFFVVGGDAQSPDTREKPVWTLEFIKVTPEKYLSVLGQLDDQWMSIREEAKRQGAVLSYERISNAGLVTPDHKLTDPITFVLTTEYASRATYLESEKLFASIREHLPSNSPAAMPDETELLFGQDPQFAFEVWPPSGKLNLCVR